MLISLKNRAVISISGEDRFKFLQGLISNDIYKLEKILYACMLTPQGRYFTDIFLYQDQDTILLDIPSAQKDALLKKLNIYKIRSAVKINDQPQLKVIINAPLGAIDPRNSIMGTRSITTDEKALSTDRTSYDLLRIKNFIPEGESDLISEKSFPLEYGLDQLNAIDYKKGCYIGQELTARTHHTGIIRKKIVQVISDTDLPPLGSEIFAEEQKLGIICSSVKNKGLALVRIENIDSLPADAIIKTNDQQLQIIFKES